MWTWYFCWVLCSFQDPTVLSAEASQPALPIAVVPSQTVVTSLNTLTSGSDEDAARALIAIAPNPAALRANYQDLIRAAEMAQGEMDICILRSACTGFHSWHATIICERKRGDAIIQWISQKLWEMPTDAERQKDVDRFCTDVQDLILSGKIDDLSGLRAVYASVRGPGIDPGVSLDSVIGLFQCFADSTDKDVRKYLLETLILLGEYTDIPKGEELFKFLKNHFPDKNFPASAYHLFFHPYSGYGEVTMSRQEYETLPTLTITQLQQKIDCRGMRCVDGHGSWAIKRILDLSRERPDEASAALANLLDRGFMTYQLSTMVLDHVQAKEDPCTADRSTGEIPGKVMDVILAKLEKRVLSPAEDEFDIVTACLGMFLRALQQKQWAGGEDAFVKGQIEMATPLVRAQSIWQQKKDTAPLQYHGSSPVDLVLKSGPNLGPETKRTLKEVVNRILADREGLADLSEASAKKAEAELLKLKNLL